jgi:hypothetical protein
LLAPVGWALLMTLDRSGCAILICTDGSGSYMKKLQVGTRVLDDELQDVFRDWHPGFVYQIRVKRNRSNP